MRLALFILSSILWAGQSVVLTTSGGTSVDPNISSGSWRVDFQIHNWSGSANGNLFLLNGTGAQVSINIPGGPLLAFGLYGYFLPQNCVVSLTGITIALVRVQFNASGAAVNGIPALTLVVEVWNYDGTAYNSCSETSSGSYRTGSGGNFGGTTADLGFLNIYYTGVAATDLLPLGSQPPVTASRGTHTAITFDCTSSPSTCLTDLSGNGNNVTYAGASYVTTPNQVAVSLPKTLGAPAWSNWLSLRAGHSNQLDGTASYSLADSSSAVTCFWFQTGGPSNVNWGGTQSNCQPSISGLLAGPYYFNLQVTDVNSSVSVAALNGTNGIGVVATDSNHIVVPPNPQVTQIFGPQIAFGYNPWTYQDQQNLAAVAAMIPYQASANDFSWTTPGQGTVAYYFGGTGFNPYPACTTLSSALTVSSTSIAVTNASCLNLTNLPTWILVGQGSPRSLEQIRICSASATTGAATLTACYDGRGVSGMTFGLGGETVPIYPTATWPSGSLVGQDLIAGTSTQFVTDPNRPMCPAGVPGPMGTIVASTGTVTLTAGSYTLTGSGTGWTSAMAGQQVLVSATHSSTAFNFWAQITTYNSATSLTMNRPAPTGVDSSSFTYQVVQPTYLSLELASVTDGHIFRRWWPGQGCESAVSAFKVPYWDMGSSYDSNFETGVHYSFKHFLAGYNSDQTPPEFYGANGLMPRSFYYRSGYAPAITLANGNDEYWVRDPEVAEGNGCQQPLTCGGGLIGAAADMTLNPNTVLTWPNIETSAYAGEIGNYSTAAGCNYTDTRDMAYQTAPLVFAANYDSNLTNRAAFTSALSSVISGDLACQRTTAQGYSSLEAGSFANSGYGFSARSNPFVLTNGSTAVTGSGFVAGTASVAGDCYGVDIITLTVTNGSSTATVASGTLSQQNLLWFYDGTNTGVYAYSVSGSAVQLAGVWTGSSGTYSAMSTGGGEITTSNVPNGGYGAIGPLPTGAQPPDNFTTNEMLRKTWACKWNSATSLTLFRPWDGASSGGSNVWYPSYNSLPAFGQEPFVVGILAYRQQQTLYNSNSTNVSNAQSILTNVGNWTATVGYDKNNYHGMYYGTVGTACGSQADIVAGSFPSIHGQSGCGQVGAALQYSGGPPYYAISRQNTVEAGTALMQWYIGNPNSTTQGLVDTAYDATWGLAGTCPALISPYCQQTALQIPGTLSGSSLSDPKWSGFGYGMGGMFTSTWPAWRLGGLAAAQPRTYSFGYVAYSGEDHRVVTVTQPSGATTVTTCTASPCALPGFDARQGDGQIMFTVYNSGSAVIAASTDPVLVKHVN